MDASQRKIIEEGMTQAFRDGLELGQMLATPPAYGVNMQTVRGIVNHAEEQTRETIEAWRRRDKQLMHWAIEGWYQASIQLNDITNWSIDAWLKSLGVPQEIINGVLDHIRAFKEKAKINMGE